MGDRVRDWMTTNPASMREDASALEALDVMVDRGIRHLPVVDSGEQVIGVLSIDDLRGALPLDVSITRPLPPLERYEAQDYRVSDAMTWAPQTARAGDALEAAADRLAEHRIGCLPVVDEHGRLEGILSETDALRALGARRRSSAPPTSRAAPPHGPDGVVDALWSERERLVERLARWQDAEGPSSDGLAGEPADSAERAADVAAAGDHERIGARASRRLRAIERALERAQQGRFGICERCQGRIPPTRLRALPEATLCVRCARTSAQAEREL